MLKDNVLENFLGNCNVPLDKNIPQVFIPRGREKAQEVSQKIFERYRVPIIEMINDKPTKMYHCPTQCGHKFAMESARFHNGHNVAKSKFQNNDHWDFINLEPICTQCNTVMGTMTFCQFIYKQKGSLLGYILEKYHAFNGKYGYPKMENILQFAYTQLEMIQPDIFEAFFVEVKQFLTTQSDTRIRTMKDNHQKIIDPNKAVLVEKRKQIEKLREQIENAEIERNKLESSMRGIEQEFDQFSESVRERAAKLESAIEKTLYRLSFS